MNGMRSPSLFNQLGIARKVFIAVMATIAAAAIIVALVAKPLLIIAGTFAFMVLAAGIWVIKTKRDFQIIFLLLFFISFFQGFIDKLKVILPMLPPSSIWGPMKYGLMALLLCRYLPEILVEMKLRINSGMRLWLGIWFVNLLIFIILIAEAKIAEPKYKPIGALQTFGIGNMFLAFMVYFDSKPRQVETMIKVFAWFGVLAAIFGIIQRLLGPVLLFAMGFDLYDPNSFVFLNSDNMETRHMDIEKGLRAFSFFASHHAFSAFLIFSTLCLQILRLQKKIGAVPYIAMITIYFGGFFVTFNLTNLMACITILFLFSLLHHAKRLKVLFRLFVNKSVWRNGIIILTVSVCAVSFIEPLRNRFEGIFDVSDQNSGAGGSLYFRMQFISNGLEAIVEHPLGLGLVLQQISNAQSSLRGYARHNFFEEHGLGFTGDAWFLYLLVQLGIVCGVVYFLLFLVPIFYGWRLKNAIHDDNLQIVFKAVLALVTVTFIGGISNSPVLVFPPANLFIWAAVGLLFKIPSWDRELAKNENDAQVGIRCNGDR
jgi:hypothetical protein